MFLLRTPFNPEILRYFHHSVTRPALQQAFKACAGFSEFALWRFFGSEGVSPVEWDKLAGAVAKDTPTDCHSDVREA